MIMLIRSCSAVGLEVPKTKPLIHLCRDQKFEEPKPDKCLTKSHCLQGTLLEMHDSSHRPHTHTHTHKEQRARQDQITIAP